jgi:3-oxoacyl-[acyl-carrier protein] reductase
MPQNAFITGGSRGIGRAIALRYVREGWGVGFTYNANEEASQETIRLAAEINPEIPVRAYKMALDNESEIEKVCEQAIEDFGNITAVINNAAIIRDNAAALMANEEWTSVIQANLTAPFLVSRAFLMHFLSNRKGRLIHMGSLSAYGSSGQINYAAAKAGLEGMSLTIAKEYGKKGITSNIVTVGYVPTDMTQSHMTKELSDFWIKHCPQRRVGTPEEIAATVLFLSSDEAGFISGENIRVSGALTYSI